MGFVPGRQHFRQRSKRMLWAEKIWYSNKDHNDVGTRGKPTETWQEITPDIAVFNIRIILTISGHQNSFNKKHTHTSSSSIRWEYSEIAANCWYSSHHNEHRMVFFSHRTRQREAIGSLAAEAARDVEGGPHLDKHIYVWVLARLGSHLKSCPLLSKFTCAAFFELMLRRVSSASASSDWIGSKHGITIRFRGPAWISGRREPGGGCREGESEYYVEHCRMGVNQNRGLYKIYYEPQSSSKRCLVVLVPAKLGQSWKTDYSSE